MTGTAGEAPELTFVRVARLAFRRLDDHTMILDPRQRQVHLLDGNGSRIWDLLERRRSIQEVVTELEREGPFEASDEQVTSDVARFVEGLVGQGLVTAGEGAGSGTR